MIAAVPQGPVEIPHIVTELAAGRPVRPVWKNELGGLTFQLGLGDTRRFVKWTPPGSGIDLSAEVARLRWAVKFTAVPPVLDEGSDESGSWIVTDGLPGHTAVDVRWKRDPGTAVRAIGSGLRALHETLPVADCPFDASAEQRLRNARAQAAAGLLDPADWHPDFAHLGSIDYALEVLADIPPVDHLVVCHGDACAPNTLVGDDGFAPGTSISARSVSPTAGPTSLSPPGVHSGTTAPVGNGSCLTRTGSPPIRSGSPTTACCGKFRTEQSDRATSTMVEVRSNRP